MKNLLLCLSGMAMLFAACKKPDFQPDFSVPEDNKPTYLRMYTNVWKDSVEIDYNSDKTIRRHANLGDITQIYNFHYTGDKLQSTWFSSDVQAPEGTEIYRIAYAGDKIAKVIQMDPNSTQGFYALMYNAAGQLTREEAFASANDLDPVTIVTYTWKDNNITREVVEDVNRNVADTVDYKYDTKHNAFKSIVMMALYTYYYPYYYSANNVTEMKETYPETGNVTLTTYEYTYDSRNYPVSRKAKVIYDYGAAPVEGVERFEYLPL